MADAQSASDSAETASTIAPKNLFSDLKSASSSYKSKEDKFSPFTNASDDSDMLESPPEPEQKLRVSKFSLTDAYPTKEGGDRFVARRKLDFESCLNFEKKSLVLKPGHLFPGEFSDQSEEACSDENSRIYQTLLQSQVLGVENPHLVHGSHLNSAYPQTPDMTHTKDPSKVLQFSDDQMADCSRPFDLPAFAGFDEDSLLKAPYTKQREIAKTPFKVLDAPALQDDFYLNLVDWSSQNQLAVGLGSCIYLWSATSSQVTKLHDIGPHDSITSVQWSKQGNLLAVGTHSGQLQIWDASRCKMVKSIGGHDGRICAVAWNSNFLSTGSRDKTILHRDLRTHSNYEAKLEGHKQEVCGLKWSHDEQQLASGGNDNKLLVWSVQNSLMPLAKFNQH